MVPSAMVMPRDGSFALGFSGSLSRIHAPMLNSFASKSMVDIVLLLETNINRPHPTDGSAGTLSRQDQLIITSAHCRVSSSIRLAAIFVALLAGTPRYF